MDTVILLSRLQFAFTVMFHYIFPPLTIGLGIILGDPTGITGKYFVSNDFAIDFHLGLDGIGDETSLIWIDPLDAPELESNKGQGNRLLQPVRHAAGGAFDNLGQKMAERMPEKRWIKILEMPRARAMAQACWAPAPPKVARTCALMSKPRMTEISRMGRTMVSLATRMKPMATCSTLMARCPLS